MFVCIVIFSRSSKRAMKPRLSLFGSKPYLFSRRAAVNGAILFEIVMLLMKSKHSIYYRLYIHKNVIITIIITTNNNEIFVLEDAKCHVTLSPWQMKKFRN